MRAITKSEAQAWCRSHEITVDERGLPQPAFADAQGVDFKIPSDTGRRIALLHQLFHSVPAGQEVLVWFDDWGVWPSGERQHMFERFRDSYGERHWLSEAPAYLFAPAEREDAVSFAGSAILFLWDCHILTETADAWLFSLTMRSAGFALAHGCLCLRRPPPNQAMQRAARRSIFTWRTTARHQIKAVWS